MFVESALVHSRLIDPRMIIYYTPWVAKFPPELWRPFTAFFLTDGGFNFIIDLYFSKDISDAFAPL